MQNTFGLLLTTLFVMHSGASVAYAQDARFTLAVKAGASAESSEDNLRGTNAALGVTGTVHIARGWGVEGEFWLPGYIDDSRGEPLHRDILLSASAVKSFGNGSVKPFVVMGLSFSRVQDWFTFCTANRPVSPSGGTATVMVSCDEPDVVDRRRERNDGMDGYLLGGGGIEFDLTRRLGIVADIRVSLAPVSVIVRPGVGLLFRF